MGEVLNSFDENEMRRFGFEPESSEDRRAWLQTEPASSSNESSYDYIEDKFIYASMSEIKPFIPNTQFPRS